MRSWTGSTANIQRRNKKFLTQRAQRQQRYATGMNLNAKPQRKEGAKKMQNYLKKAEHKKTQKNQNPASSSRCFVSDQKPAASTRSASTSPTSDIPSSATNFTATTRIY